MRIQHRLQYVCTVHWVKDEDGRQRKAYRLHVMDTGKKEAQLLLVVNDICSTESDARRLVDYLQRNQLSPKHIMDVLEDWVS